MNCKKCKSIIPEGSLYCNYCGAAQKRDTKKKMYQRPDGLFETSKKVDGKRVVFRGKTEHEVMDKMIQYQATEDTGPLFSEVALAWQEETWNNISSNTKKGYSAAYKKAMQVFGDMYIKEISTNDVRAYILDFVNKSFAFKTVKNYLLVLHLILQRAYLDEIIPSNLADRVTIPKVVILIILTKHSAFLNPYTSSITSQISRSLKLRPVFGQCPYQIYFLMSCQS